MVLIGNLHAYMEPYFRPFPNPVYWPQYMGPFFLPDAGIKWTSKKRPESTRLHMRWTLGKDEIPSGVVNVGKRDIYKTIHRDP